jgi:hypothetical protein
VTSTQRAALATLAALLLVVVVAVLSYADGLPRCSGSVCVIVDY